MENGERDELTNTESPQEGTMAVAVEGRPARDQRARTIADRAKEIAPNIRSAYQPFEARSFLEILGRKDTVAFLGLDSDEGRQALDGRDAHDVLHEFARGELETSDPVATILRRRSREIGRDERAKNLWGRKIVALALAVEEERAERRQK